jgi:hypothetical protein
MRNLPGFPGGSSLALGPAAGRTILNMNLWKSIALALVAAVAFSAGNTEADAAGVCHDQPNMAAALGQLRGARASLAKAEHDKGGWRAAAIVASDNAIKETERGCAFDNTH